MKQKMLGAAREKGCVTYKREMYQTSSRPLSGNPTSQKRLEANIQHSYKKEFPTQHLTFDHTMLHKQRRNKILFRQANAEGIHHHHACLARAPEGNFKFGDRKTLLATTKTH